MSAKTIKAFQSYLVRQGKAPANNPDVYRGTWWPMTEKMTQEPEKHCWACDGWPCVCESDLPGHAYKSYEGAAQEQLNPAVHEKQDDNDPV